jgi:hypothetical protein
LKNWLEAVDEERPKAGEEDMLLAGRVDRRIVCQLVRSTEVVTVRRQASI